MRVSRPRTAVEHPFRHRPHTLDCVVVHHHAAALQDSVKCFLRNLASSVGDYPKTVLQDCDDR